MQCSSTAVASCLRLLATIFLLLAMAGRCHSQQLDNIQLSRIQGSIEDLTHVVQELSENVTAGIGKLSDVTAGIGKLSDVTAGIGKLSDVAAGIGKLSDVAAGIGKLTDVAAGIGKLSEDVAAGIGKLSDVAAGIGKLSENVTSGIGKMFNLLAIDHLYCENGWVKLRSSCYFLGKDTSTWEQSRQKCLALDSDLVTITRDEEYNFLRDLAKGHSTYVGLNDLQEEGTYRWVADGTIHQIVESWWAEGEPNNHGSREHCVHFYRSKDDRLNDHICANEFRYICEKPAQLDWNSDSVSE